MTPFQIYTYPDKRLKQRAKPVDNIDGALQEIIDRMAFTMYQAPGVGLAAIQVGIDKSIMVYDVTAREEKRDLHVIINPKILSCEGETISENEGCLSVPDYRADVKRAKSVLVEGFDRDGNPLRIDAEDFLAVVLQHEIDHLNGKLFIDRISRLKRELYKKRILKQLKRK
ncbi:MAG: peptide deformylase [Deltaproteobacteria bacterium]|nr:peptide deformylase [Deltaproteobacteria bacterium]MBW2151931.1 peptide deformylase [Deltaproteobacteria bacterium]